MLLTDTLDLLTNTQRKVFIFLIKGQKAPEIAKKMGTSLRCIYNHQVSIYKRLGVRNSYELISRYSYKELEISDLVDRLEKLTKKVAEIEKKLPQYLPTGKL